MKSVRHPVLHLAAAILIAASIPSARGADAQDKVYLDASKTGAPISKYVYGQFVEHLGRSVYGGLWAEMVEDRKFARPITDDPVAVVEREVVAHGARRRRVVGYRCGGRRALSGPPGTGSHDGRSRGGKPRSGR